MMHLRKMVDIVLAALREIFDESAYRRSCSEGRWCLLAKRMPSLCGSMNFYERDGQDVAEGAAFNTQQSVFSLSIIIKLR